MPTYINDCGSTIEHEGVPFPPGEEVEINKYIIHPDLTLASHEPKIFPFKTLHEGPPPVPRLNELSEWNQIIIMNESGAALTMIANWNSGQIFHIQDGAAWTFDLNRQWGSVLIEGGGEGNVYVYGVL